jgi:hypothetical protein
VNTAQAIFDVVEQRTRQMLNEIEELLAAGTADSGTSAVRRPGSSRPGVVGTVRWLWSEVEDRYDETWGWPRQGGGTNIEVYAPFKVYEGRSEEGRVRLGLGWCERTAVWGRDRRYIIAFHVRNGSKQPLVEFLETDDAATSGEFIAIIRGKGATRKEMYAPGDSLPRGYEHLRLEDYRSRVEGGWRRLGVVAHEDDTSSMLDHALIQARLRYGVTPTKGGEDA